MAKEDSRVNAAREAGVLNIEAVKSARNKPLRDSNQAFHSAHFKR